MELIKGQNPFLLQNKGCPASPMPLTLLESKGRGKTTWSISGQKLSVASDAEFAERQEAEGDDDLFY